MTTEESRRSAAGYDVTPLDAAEVEELAADLDPEERQIQ